MFYFCYALNLWIVSAILWAFVEGETEAGVFQIFFNHFETLLLFQNLFPDFILIHAAEGGPLIAREPVDLIVTECHEEFVAEIVTQDIFNLQNNLNWWYIESLGTC